MPDGSQFISRPVALSPASPVGDALIALGQRIQRRLAWYDMPALYVEGLAVHDDHTAEVTLTDRYRGVVVREVFDLDSGALCYRRASHA